VNWSAPRKRPDDTKGGPSSSGAAFLLRNATREPRGLRIFRVCHWISIRGNLRLCSGSALLVFLPSLGETSKRRSSGTQASLIAPRFLAFGCLPFPLPALRLSPLGQTVAKPTLWRRKYLPPTRQGRAFAPPGANEFSSCRTRAPANKDCTHDDETHRKNNRNF